MLLASLVTWTLTWLTSKDFLMSLFPATLPLGCTDERGCCDPRAGAGTWPCWPCSIGSTCPDPSLELFYLPACQHFHPTWCCSHIYFGVSLIPASSWLTKILNRAEGDTTNDQMAARFSTIHHHFLDLAVQPVFDVYLLWFLQNILANNEIVFQSSNCFQKVTIQMCKFFRGKMLPWLIQQDSCYSWILNLFERRYFTI